MDTKKWKQALDRRGQITEESLAQGKNPFYDADYPSVWWVRGMGEFILTGRTGDSIEYIQGEDGKPVEHTAPISQFDGKEASRCDDIDVYYFMTQEEEDAMHAFATDQQMNLYTKDGDQRSSGSAVTGGTPEYWLTENNAALADLASWGVLLIDVFPGTYASRYGDDWTVDVGGDQGEYEEETEYFVKGSPVLEDLYSRFPGLFGDDQYIRVDVTYRLYIDPEELKSYMEDKEPHEVEDIMAIELYNGGTVGNLLQE